MTVKATDKPIDLIPKDRMKQIEDNALPKIMCQMDLLGLDVNIKKELLEELGLGYTGEDDALCRYQKKHST